MRPDPAQPPILRIVDTTAPRPDTAAPRLRPAPKISLLGRMIEASEPGDIEALLIGLTLGVLLVIGLVISDNLALIGAWLLG